MRYYNQAIVLGLVLVGGVFAVRPAAAQDIPPDSVAAYLRSLQRRLDSLEQVIRELRAAGEEPAAAVDELAALRAAAQAAAAEGAAAAPVPATDQQSRTGNLNALNPEISVTGDVVGNFIKPDGEDHAFNGTPREFEFSFQAALDPYTRTKIFVTREEDFEIAGFPEEEGAEEEGHGFEIEEGYMYWVGLPGGFGAKIGKFRQEIGLYNRWHTHALLEVERSLATTTFLGEDGLIQTGAAITLPSFTAGPTTQTLLFEVTRGDNEALFDAGSQISYLGRFQTFWDISPSTFLQLGSTGVWGQNDDVGLETRLLGLDFHVRYRPGGATPYRDIQLKGEWYFAERDEVGTTVSGTGGYAQANFRAGRQWILGARADVVDGYTGFDLFQLAPSITWWQSEWVRLRLQYNYLKPETLGANHTVLLQFVWAMGPHKHETY